MKLAHTSVICFLIFSFLGCATTPVSPDLARAVPKERILGHQYKSLNNNSTLIVTRDEGFLGGGCFLGFYVNGILVARFDTGEIAQFYIEPGEILLKVTQDPEGKGLCAIKGGFNGTQRETILKPGDVKRFRIMTDAQGNIDIQRSDHW